MNHCPNCKGTGKQSVSFSTYGSGKPPEISLLDCFICKGGEMPMTELEAVQYKRHQDAQNKLWCACDNVNGNVTYVPDGASKKCRKHHWIHNACGKIVQVG